MTNEDYLKKSADIKKRLDIVRDQIDNHVKANGNTSFPPAGNLVERQQGIIDELTELDSDFFKDS